MADSTNSGSRQSARYDARDVSPSPTTRSSAQLYRAPTWARSINFDSPSELINQTTLELNGYVSPSDGQTGLALGGSPHLSDHQVLAPSGPWGQGEATYLPTSRNVNAVAVPQARRINPHTRQLSNTPIQQPSRNSSNLIQASPMPKAISRSNNSSMLPIHQRVASASSATGSTDWLRSPMPSQLHSSADLYATANSRPSTSMSTISASVDENKEDRLDSGTSHALHNRASVLSFQTARSQGGDYDDSQTFASAPTSEMEVLDRTLPPRPWLTQPTELGPSGSSSFNSSIDERHLPPGGWASASPWNNGAAEALSARGRSIRNSPPTSNRQMSAELGGKSPSLSPRLRLANLNESTSPQQSTNHSRTPSGSQSLSAQEQKSIRPVSMLRNDTTEDTISAQSLGFISGSSTVDAPIEQNSKLITTTKPSQSTSQNQMDQNESLPATQQISLPEEQSDNNTTAATNKLQEKKGPVVPEKPLAPSIPPKNEVGLSSPPLSDNVIAIPMSTNASVGVPVDVASIPVQVQADRSPVADFRRTPLVAMSKDVDENSGMTMDASTDTLQKENLGRRTRPFASTVGIGAAGPVTAAGNVVGAVVAPTRVRPGVGAHASRNSGADQTAAPAFAALMRKPSNGSIPRASLSTSLPPAPLDRSPSPSIDTPPREDSPPPEGEVEARAEWERAQMRQMAERAKKASGAPRKSTFRGQLKPLQLVAAEETKRAGKASPKRGSPVQSKNVILPDSPLEEVRGGQGDESGPSATATVSRSTSGGSAGLNTMTANASPGLAPVNGKSGGVMSTQQLQRQLARDQRRSVSAVNMTMGQMGGVGDIGGAYPVFPSPSTSPNMIIGSNRQYPGLMPQRSLVPPFELQNRPDGLPSALTGPDGVRRSPNDPEVCLECMMRDEDMIDVHVLGAGMWERESDLDFVEAIRLEGEEDSKRDRARQIEASISNGTDNGTSESTTGNAAGEGESVTNSKEAATVAIGSLSSSYPRLTKIRVKRVAKGEPLTTERLKLHTQMNPPASSHRWRTLQTFLAIQAKYIAMEQKARGIIPPAVPPKSAPMYDNGMVKTMSGDSRSAQRQRVASPVLFQVKEVPLTAEEKANKERDIASAREARRRNNTLGNATTAVQGTADATLAVEDVSGNRLSGPPIINDNSSGHNSIPRRSNAGPGTYARAGSIQDLRTVPNSMTAKKDTLQPLALNSNTLAPPQASFRGPPSPNSPRSHGTRMRSASSTMSLANSGSMIDMHVGLENSKDHRISQAGFVPGTPLHSQSPSALNRAFYGFPGDGEAEQGEDWSQYRGYDQNMANSFGDYDDGYSGARYSPDLERRKKKSGGLRGFFSKISGKEASEQRPEDESMDSRDRKSYMRPDSSMELQPPPGMSGLLNRARRSTSSLLMPSGRQSMDSTIMLGGDRGFSNPLMASQTSLEMGPFGSGPLPPPRKDSRLSQIPQPRSPSPTKEKDKSSRRLRAFSSGNLMAKKKGVSIPSPTSRTSSMMQGVIPATTPNGDHDPYDRSNAASRLSNRRDQPPTVRPREGSYGTSPGLPFGERESQQTQDGQIPRSIVMQNDGQQDQHHNIVQHRYNRSDVFLPNGNTADLQGRMSEDVNAPRRPPRNPDRDAMSGISSGHQAEYGDGMTPSRSPLQIPLALQKEQYSHSYDSQNQSEARLSRSQDRQNEQQRMSSFVYTSPPPDFQSNVPTSSTVPSRKSKLLKLPFGKKKRESAAISVATTTKETNSLKSRSSRGTFDENAAYYATPPNNGSFTNQPGLDSLRGNPRSRNDSNASWEDRNFPPRSQSALGTSDGANTNSPTQANTLRGFFPRLRTTSRAALREVVED